MTQETRSKPFFAVGDAKSGTTFLQRMLDMHPEVSCPSEQQLDGLREGFDFLLDQYQGGLTLIDKRTGGQGAPKLRLGLRGRMFRDMVTRMSIELAAGKPIHGLNDNGVFSDLRKCDEQFRQPRFLVLFRNPTDVAVSAWRHNHRLTRVDAAHADVHRKVLEQHGGSFEAFVRSVVRSSTKKSDQAIKYASNRPNFLLLRYEDLVADKVAQLERIFAFLGARSDLDTLQQIVDSSSREAMARTSRSPGFFGVGPDAEPPIDVPVQFRQELADTWLTPWMKSLGYDRDAV